MATENKKINNPVINVLTQAQYNSITNPSEDEFYLITDDIAQVTNGGTGLASLTAGSVLIGNGTNPVTLKAIDTTVGGTANSTDLITSGAVYSGLNENKLPLQKGAGTNSLMHINANSASGDYSFAEGGGTTASGESSHAEGSSSLTAINYQTQLGQGAAAIIPQAGGTAAHIEGYQTTTNTNSMATHAEGYQTIAGPIGSGGQPGDHAEGYQTYAYGGASHAEGNRTKASGIHSHAEGSETTASGTQSHAEGGNTTASGYVSHAEGRDTIASGNQSHAEGWYTIANHKSQHVFGDYNIADPSTAGTDQRGNYIEIVGNGTSENSVITRSNARTLDWSGNEVLSGTLTSAGLKIGNVLSHGIDTTTGGTSTSTSLITSGAVYGGLAQKSDGVIIRTWS